MGIPIVGALLQSTIRVKGLGFRARCHVARSGPSGKYLKSPSLNNV